ncbi:MAG: HlyD family secretion protein [Bacteroides sp.]|nr:HlyD family secretion protein [Bacteroides sp.]
MEEKQKTHAETEHQLSALPESDIELKSEEFQEILGSVPPWILRKGITLVGVITLFIFAGSAVFKYPDILSTSMTLTGASPATTLIARVSGKIDILYVLDQQEIKAGTYLAILENTACAKDIQFLKEYVEQLNYDTDSLTPLLPRKLKLGSLHHSYSVFYGTLFEFNEFKRLKYYKRKIDYMEKKISQYHHSYHNILRQKKIIDEQFRLCQNQYNRDSILYQRGMISAEESEQARNQYLQSNLSMENIRYSIQDIELQMTQLEENLLEAEYEYMDKKNTFTMQLRHYTSQLLAEIQEWEMNYALVAPTNGKVTFTNYWVENQNVIAGETVFTIVPHDNERIIGKAQMPLTRSGKVRPGQKVNIRFMNFPDSEYGVVKGIVENISMVPVKNTVGEDHYTVEIALPNGLLTSYNRELPYQPEAQAQADIITDDLSLLQRFIMPLKKIITESISYE